MAPLMLEEGLSTFIPCCVEDTCVRWRSLLVHWSWDHFARGPLNMLCSRLRKHSYTRVFCIVPMRGLLDESRQVCCTVPKCALQIPQGKEWQPGHISFMSYWALAKGLKVAFQPDQETPGYIGRCCGTRSTTTTHHCQAWDNCPAIQALHPAHHQQECLL